ncbi:MAG: hypothetical protein AAFR61_05305 [Bacteroidota bacterium]
MKFQRSRRWLAAGNLLLMAGLMVSLMIWPSETGLLSLEGLPSAAVVGLFLGIYWLISLPIDFLGGYRLPALHGKTVESPGQWFKRWLRASLVHLLLLWVQGMLLWEMGAWLGLAGVIGGLILIMLLLLSLQLWIGRALNGWTVQPENDRGRLVMYVTNQNQAFTGGIAGLPGNEVIVLPQYWKTRFSEKVMKMILARRQGAIVTASHGRGAALAFLTQLICFGLAAWLGGMHEPNASHFLQTIGLYSLFNLLPMLFLLPGMSRKATLEVDRWTFYKNADADLLREAFKQTSRLQDLEQAFQPAWLGFFHPTPTLPDRQAAMQTQKPQKGSWFVLAYSQYLSWAGLNLLGRSWSAQIGRPELWAFLPGD